MPLKSNVALSYIAMLSVVGFFLWVVRNFVRGLRQKDGLPPASPILTVPDDADKKAVNWQAHVFLNNEDDIPIPGRVVSVSPGGAFLESSACLKNDQNISIYVDTGAGEQVRLTAQVVWARESRDGRNAAQLVFPAGASEADLYSQIK